jgi:hypothetical protein
MTLRRRCEVVPASSVGPLRLFGDQCRKTAWSGVARLCSPDLAWRLVEFALARPGPPKRAFAVPQPLVMRALGKALEVEMPVAALQMRMHDWVLCDDKIIHTGRWFLACARWEDLIHPARPSSVMREAVHLRKAGLDFRNTASYERYLQLIEQGAIITRNHVRLDSRERLDDYFERFARLYRSIERHGVLRARDVRISDGAMPGSTAPGRTSAQGKDADIGIAIGPQGQIAVLPGAKHRLSVATVLKLRKVPVEVRLVHADWLRRIGRRHPELDMRGRLAMAIERARRLARRSAAN